MSNVPTPDENIESQDDWGNPPRDKEDESFTDDGLQEADAESRETNGLNGCNCQVCAHRRIDELEKRIEALESEQ